MKRIALLLSLMLLFSCSVFAQGFTLGSGTQGIWDDGGTPKANTNKLIGLPVVMNNSSAEPVGGFTNGFCVYVADAAGGQAGNTLSGSFLPIWWDSSYTGWQYVLMGSNWVPIAPEYTTVFTVKKFGIDGLGADTVAFGAAKGEFTDGWPAGWNNVLINIHTNVDIAMEGKFLCLDSCYYPPTGIWKWAPQGIPSWGGPYCFEIEKQPDPPPVITCPGAVHTGNNCAAITSGLVTATDEDASGAPGAVTFSLGAISGAGTASITVVTPGSSCTVTYTPDPVDDRGDDVTVTVIATDGATQTDECVVNFHVNNIAPVINNCPGKQTITKGDALAIDLNANADCDQSEFVWSVVPDVAPAGAYGINASTGEFFFNSVDADGDMLYTFTVTLTDGVDADECVFQVDVLSFEGFRVVIEKVHDQIMGTTAGVDVTLAAAAGALIRGFDFLIAYDATALGTPTPVPGPLFGVDKWEYFTYRHGADGNCGSACPNGLIRVVGIAETNNGPFHPDFDVLDAMPTPIVLFTLNFLVTTDANYECQYVPVRFFWTDCPDNSIAFHKVQEYALEGELAPVYQGVARWILNYVGGGIGNYALDPDYMYVNGDGTGDPTLVPTFPSYLGIIAQCLVGDKFPPIQYVDFFNGGVDIICNNDVDDRGDINMNGTAYEIADAVLFSNYFVYGLGVFQYIAGSTAASDVNADGLTLSVADLVYLVRVIVGDAIPYSPSGYIKLASSTAAYTFADGILSVNDKIGAAFVVVAGDVTPTNLANVDMQYAFDGANTRILLASLDRVASFEGAILEVGGEIVSCEFATPEGGTVAAKIVPASYELVGNYPNPFNPATTIKAALPQAGDYTLTIYNVAGQKVADFAGHAQAGILEVEWNAANQASGVYFYKLNVNNFTDTKKMVLVK